MVGPSAEKTSPLTIAHRCKQPAPHPPICLQRCPRPKRYWRPAMDHARRSDDLLDGSVGDIYLRRHMYRNLLHAV